MTKAEQERVDALDALTTAQDTRIACLEEAMVKLIDGVGQLSRQFFGISTPERLRGQGLDAVADLLVADRARTREASRS